jgi:hypothetical protein
VHVQPPSFTHAQHHIYLSHLHGCDTNTTTWSITMCTRFSVSWLFQPRHLRVRGKRNIRHRITVRPAPAPSMILWEHQAVSVEDHMVRKAGMAGVGLVSVVGSTYRAGGDGERGGGGGHGLVHG